MVPPVLEDGLFGKVHLLLIHQHVLGAVHRAKLHLVDVDGLLQRLLQRPVRLARRVEVLRERTPALVVAVPAGVSDGEAEVVLLLRHTHLAVAVLVQDKVLLLDLAALALEGGDEG